MRTTDFDYSLPPERIAQHPPATRSGSRLMKVCRTSQTFQPGSFLDLPNLLHPGDVLVLNNSKVIPARLFGSKVPSGGTIEILLTDPAPAPEGGWWVMLRPGKRVRPGSQLRFGPPQGPELPAELVEKRPDGLCRLIFPPDADVLAFAEAHGTVPLPPYIQRPEPIPQDRERYQTVYASRPGSAAAPTAGLHFSHEVLTRLRANGIHTAELTLHVGLGTFSPVKVDHVRDHEMHTERYDLPIATVEAIQEARRRGGRVVAIGTTSLRVLESVARQHQGRLVPGPGNTRLFLHPPADFLCVDALLTNFHLPKSTLLMLVSAFAAPGRTTGRDLILAAYRAAIDLEFRFFSYGDAMWIA